MNTNSLATHFYKTDPVKNLHTNIFIDKVCNAKILLTTEAIAMLVPELFATCEPCQ